MIVKERKKCISFLPDKRTNTHTYILNLKHSEGFEGVWGNIRERKRLFFHLMFCLT